ncbi:putative F-box protein [Raphanus sativus]|uniref:F-box protein At1g71320 n=1 Tax=Raphanus sativus TaxID=3726 RepID=A0A6J0N086_RAPSA|nr:putative F-box protein At1g71320 [Raphanus sativus]KAJ4917730.1 putative F-box protein [Raphanus sativus]
MGEPKTTSWETLATATQVPAPPDLSHFKKRLSASKVHRRQHIKEEKKDVQNNSLNEEEGPRRQLREKEEKDERTVLVCAMGEPKTTTWETLATDTQVPTPPDLSHFKKRLSANKVHRRQHIKEEKKDVQNNSLNEEEGPRRQLREKEEKDVQNNSRNQEERPRVIQVVITDHIIEGLLLERLPEKSLCRFKSVSKQWKSTIESSYLAKKRLARYPNPRLLVLRLEMSTDRCSRTIFLENISKDHHDHNKIIIYTHRFPHPVPTNYGNENIGRIMGYCNGFVCIYDSGYIYLLNPATRRLRILSPTVLLEYTGRSGWSRELPISVGFGRDITTGAYKVILMYLFDRIFVKAEVFNLNNGERGYTFFPPFYHELSNDKLSVFANGSLFWLSWLETSAFMCRKKLPKLGAIDLHTEKFRDVLLPCWYTEHSESVYLWSLRERLCLSDVLQYPNMYVWCLQQEDPSVKWEKILSVNMSSLDCLDPNYWKLGLAACDLRRTRNEPHDNFLEHVRKEHRRTVLYTENLFSSL